MTSVKSIESGQWLVSLIIFVLLCVSASGRHLLDFDLDTAAAEPRPIFIETGPSAEALPLVYSVDKGQLSDASEKIEKVLRPAIAFSYNQQDVQDREAAELKLADQKPAAVNYYKYVEAEEKKEGAGNANENKEVELGGDIAESKQHGHKHSGGGHGGGHGGGGGGGGHGDKFGRGGGKEHHSHHAGEHGEKGDKGYKGHHHHEKGQKGHHDKENHSKEYEEKGGHKKKHHHDDGYHGEHHKAEGGKKAAKYSEKGEHNKGHSTKGSHSIHKKDEYEKKTEFFEEDNEGGESEKHGGFSHKDEYKKGGHKKGGHENGGHHEDHYGKKGESSKGGFFKEEKGHNDKGGHKEQHKHDSKYGKKEGASSGKKWAFKKGSGHGGGGGGGGHGVGGHGGGHGHGAHSHQNYAVQQPPKEVQASEISPVKTYDITPISTYILPLENEPESEEGKNEETPESNRQDEEGTSSELVKLVVAKESEITSPLDALATQKLLAIQNPGYTDLLVSTTPSALERLIHQELLKNGKANFENRAESKKVGKKRRLKKRKIQKDKKGVVNSRSLRKVSQPPSHTKEGQLSQESSHSFVIVAADDAL